MQDSVIIFPEITPASGDIIAYGADLSSACLLAAYRQGIFPWFAPEDPITWWSPDPRMVLFPQEIKISKSMRQLLKKNTFNVTYNKAFSQVIRHCATIKRKEEEGTWITPEMIIAYEKLHQQGHAMSVEVWQDQKLVGGLYGIDLKTIFCGESMFSLVSNASKVAFISLAQRLEKQNYKLIDCQMHTNHLESMGAKEIPREVFLSYLP